MIIGIDLGTSTSAVSVLKNGKPHLIREVRGSSRGILPSVVGVNSGGSVVVGEDIVAQLVLKPELAVQEVKRKMGSGEKVCLGAEEYTPQEVSAFIIRHLKEESERFLGEAVTDAVITVPAYFTDVQRRATEDAGELAGLTVRRLINEPTAAALAYGIERPGIEEHVVVYDLGGGTLDVTVLELSEGVLDVLASTGNTRLGGKDFDERLMSYVATECRRSTGIELLASPRGRQRLKKECKRVKEALSASESVTIALDNLSVAADGSPIDFELEVSRAKFEELIRDLVLSTREQLDEALAAKSLSRDQIKTVLLVGGSTRVPLVREFVSHYFGARVLPAEVAPDEAVCLGAAVLAGILDSQIDPSTTVITDVSPFSLGIAVARDIGDRTVSGFFDALIEKQSTIPRTAKKIYATSRDWQDAVHVQVFQGDAPMCADNEPILDFMHPMEPQPEGATVEIEITYNLNAMVEIVARDPRTGRVTRKEIRPERLGMSESEKREARQKLDSRWRTSQGAPAAPTRAAGSPGIGQNAPTGSSHATPPDPARPPAARPVEASPLFARVAALIAFAEKQLPTLAPGPKAQTEQLLSHIRAAILANDSAALDTHERRLTDLLFELD